MPRRLPPEGSAVQHGSYGFHRRNKPARHLTIDLLEPVRTELGLIQFLSETRAIGMSFSYSVSVTIFGGFAPFVATWLIAQTGDKLSPSYYLMATSVLSMIAIAAAGWRLRAGPAH